MPQKVDFGRCLQTIALKRRKMLISVKLLCTKYVIIKSVADLEEGPGGPAPLLFLDQTEEPFTYCKNNSSEFNSQKTMETNPKGY